ncbi:hypothetical protein [Scytonema sp. NUACC26]
MCDKLIDPSGSPVASSRGTRPTHWLTTFPLTTDSQPKEIHPNIN